MDNVKSRAISALKWSLTSQISQQVIGLTITVFLARLLGPADFGLIAISLAMASLMLVISEAGLGTAIIQREDLSEGAISSSFWLISLSVILSSVVLWSSASFVAEFLSMPGIYAVAPALTVYVLISGFGIIPRILALRKMKLRVLSVVQVVSTLIAGLIAIAMALRGFSYWSLVAQALVSVTLTTCVLWLLSEWRPRLVFNPSEMKSLLAYSRYVLATHILDFWTKNLDTVLIAKFLTDAVLGEYSRAYSLMITRLTAIPREVSKIFFPAISELQSDPKRLSNAFVRTLALVFFISTPFMVGLFACANSFVLTVFGSQWIGMVPILQALCLLGVMIVLGSLHAKVYLALGRSKLHFRIGVISKSIVFFGITIGIYWGGLGVAVGYGVATVVVFLMNTVLIRKVIPLSLVHMFTSLAPTFVSLFIMGFLVTLVGMSLQGLAVWQVLMWQLVTGVIVYSMCSFIICRNLVMEIYNALLRGSYNSRESAT
jgi:O-antigen/teichoic acid export membrane protein